MSTQHTPGPWTQGTSNVGKECVWLDGRTEPKGEMGPSDIWIDCCTEANARLIAAAPELLAVVKKAREYINENLASLIECEKNPETGLVESAAVPLIEADQKLLNAVDAAIAKAEGGAA